jgi:hypothetical protein
MVSRITKELGTKPKVIATGGFDTAWESFAINSEFVAGRSIAFDPRGDNVGSSRARARDGASSSSPLKSKGSFRPNCVDVLQFPLWVGRPGEIEELVDDAKSRLKNDNNIFLADQFNFHGNKYSTITLDIAILLFIIVAMLSSAIGIMRWKGKGV